MKKYLPLALIVLASLAVAEEARRGRTQRPSGPANFNPSRTISPINPSQAIPRINPSQPALPASPGPGGAPAPRVPSGPPLTVQIWMSIAKGPNALRGFPSFGNPGIPVRGLLVETDRGRVVLRGVVRTEQDKAEAGARAAALAGAGKVVNLLSVSPVP